MVGADVSDMSSSKTDTMASASTRGARREAASFAFGTRSKRIVSDFRFRFDSFRTNRRRAFSLNSLAFSSSSPKLTLSSPRSTRELRPTLSPRSVCSFLERDGDKMMETNAAPTSMLQSPCSKGESSSLAAKGDRLRALLFGAEHAERNGDLPGAQVSWRREKER